MRAGLTSGGARGLFDPRNARELQEFRHAYLPGGGGGLAGGGSGSIWGQSPLGTAGPQRAAQIRGEIQSQAISCLK